MFSNTLRLWLLVVDDARVTWTSIRSSSLIDPSPSSSARDIFLDSDRCGDGDAQGEKETAGAEPEGTKTNQADGEKPSQAFLCEFQGEGIHLVRCVRVALEAGVETRDRTVGIRYSDWR